MFKNPKIKNVKLKILFKSFLFAVLVFGFWPLVYSQTLPGLNLSPSDIFDISVSNRRPFPNEKITAKIINANFDVARADIRWILNGKTILQGKAEDEAVFEVGGPGSSAILTASILTPAGQQIQKSITLRPADMDILWQADAYTPYFYKGKGSVSPSSNVAVAAIPHFIFQGTKIQPENLLFKWYLYDNFQTKGWGKDSFTFKTGLFTGEDYEVRVEISSASEILSQKRSLKITPQNPQIIFYEYNPFEGAKAQKAVSSFVVAGGEFVQFIAEPYFAPNDKLQELVYEWRMNGEKLARLKPFNILNFSSAPGSSGKALVNLTISYENLLEKISESFNIQIQ